MPRSDELREHPVHRADECGWVKQRRAHGPAMHWLVGDSHGAQVLFGIGIGPLPTYIVAMGIDLIPLDIDLRHQVDIWMTYHPDARSISRVSHFIDWLRTLFDPKRYPWFGDEFIHPNELAKAHAPKLNATLLNLPILWPLSRMNVG